MKQTAQRRSAAGFGDSPSRGLGLLALVLAPLAAHAQTEMVRDINPSGASRDYADLIIGTEDAVLFSADNGITGRALWRSDGTGAGTTLVADLFGASGFFPATRLASNGSLAFFVVNDGFTGAQPWRSDGTTGGTFAITTPATASDVVDLFAGFERFGAGAMFEYHSKLWSSDGSLPGTAQAPALITLSNLPLANVDGSVVAYGTFPAVGNTYGLLHTDGSVAGTQMIDTTGVAAFQPVAVNGRLYFVYGAADTGTELHALDAGAITTRVVKDIVPGFTSSNPQHLTRVDDRLFFTASEPAAGEELWVTDGTDLGTYRVKDIVPGPNSSSPMALVALGSKLYFAASTPATGYELWQSDGTDAGTTMVVDLDPGTESGLTGAGIYNRQDAIAAVNGRIFFQGRPDHFGFGARLWMLDAAGLVAQPVDESTFSLGPMVPFNGKLLFTGSSQTSGMEPFAADLLNLVGNTWCAKPEAVLRDDGGAMRFSVLLPDRGNVYAPTVSLDIGHTHVGDLTVNLVHRESATLVGLVKRPGTAFAPDGCASDLMDIRLVDGAAASADSSCAIADQRLAYPRGADYRPTQALSTLNGEALAGHWDLYVIDAAPGHAGTLHQWCLSWSGPAIYGDSFEGP